MRKALPVFSREALLTTFLTIDRIRTLGNNGTESSGKHDLSEQMPLNGVEKVRKKIITLFGTRMPRVRVSPLGPKVQNPLMRSLDFFVCMERDSNN